MKALLAALCLSFSANAMAAAEIQIFMNYRGPDDYDSKLVSTPDNPQSAASLYVPEDGVAVNGACYKGDPEEALVLFKTMVSLFNGESARAIRAWGSVYHDETTDAPSLNIWASEDEMEWEWFPRMRECVRWSTPEERGDGGTEDPSDDNDRGDDDRDDCPYADGCRNEEPNDDDDDDDDWDDNDSGDRDGDHWDDNDGNRNENDEWDDEAPSDDEDWN